MTSQRTNTLTIRTPEGLVFSLPLAGPVARFLAVAIDLACISMAAGALNTLAKALAIVATDFAQAVYVTFYFSVSIGYGMALEWFWHGQTIGKRLLHLRVMDSEGLRLRPSQVILRNLVRVLDMLPGLYLVGGTACVLTRHCQRLGDLAANTIVVRSDRTELPDVEQLRSGKYNSLRAYPHLAARLRRNVPADVAAIAAGAILRRDELEPAVRLELFRDLATWFRKLVEFPAEATDDIADEQYVRNVVEIVFTTRGPA